MRRTGNALLGFGVMLLCGVGAGCVGPASGSAPRGDVLPRRPAPSAPASTIQQAVYHQAGPTGPAVATPALAQPSAPVPDLPELTAEALVEQVLARNPSLAQMVA